MVSDDLKVTPLNSAAIISLLTKFGVSDMNATEELTVNIGIGEVMNVIMP